MKRAAVTTVSSKVTSKITGTTAPAVEKPCEKAGANQRNPTNIRNIWDLDKDLADLRATYIITFW
jgi:hypothetical protein